MEEMLKIVSERKGVSVTSSRKVAEIFGKEHKDVLETIRETIKIFVDADNLTAKFSRNMFCC